MLNYMLQSKKSPSAVPRLRAPPVHFLTEQANKKLPATTGLVVLVGLSGNPRMSCLSHMHKGMLSWAPGRAELLKESVSSTESAANLPPESLELVQSRGASV